MGEAPIQYKFRFEYKFIDLPKGCGRKGNGGKRTMTEIKQRYEILDILRGFALINMIAFHGLWDLINLEGMRLSSTASHWTYIWQQGICSLFILLSGFCWSLGKRHFRHGCVVFAAGILVSAVTWVIMPEQSITFGILTFLGSSMLIMIPLEFVLKKIGWKAGLFVSIIFFIGTKNINSGSLGFGDYALFRLPENLYKGYIATYLGFTDPGFASTDYFSLFPWFFLFLSGYFLFRLFREKGWLSKLKRKAPGKNVLAFMGRHSLIFYLLHQPCLLFLMELYNIVSPL